MQQGYGYGPPPSVQRQEYTFFTGNGVQVTSGRFVVGGQMYPMQGITSVSQFVIPPSRAWAIIGTIFFGLGALGGLISAAKGEGVFGFILCGALLGLCVWRLTKAKAQYGISITTAGMQVRAIVHPDGNFVQQVLGALHQAISTR